MTDFDAGGPDREEEEEPQDKDECDRLRYYP